MAVLDTFYILFKSDSEAAEKGAKKVSETVGKLESEFGGADKASISLGKKFNALATAAVAAFASVFTVTQLISNARGIAAQSTALGVLSDFLGDSASELVNWGRAVENMGGTSAGFEGSMRSLATFIQDAYVGGMNAGTDALNQLQISARDAEDGMRKPLQVLPLLAKELHGLKPEVAFARGRALGFDENTIRLLMLGERTVLALVARQRALNLTSDDEIKKLRELGVRWTEYKNLLGDSRREILSSLIPSIEDLERKIISLAGTIRDNQGSVGTFIKGIGLLAGGKLALTILRLAIPFLRVTAVITGVGLAVGFLIEDIERFNSGEESSLQKAIDRWSFVQAAVDLVRDSIKVVLGLFDDMEGARKSAEPTTILEGLKEGTFRLFDVLDDSFKTFTGNVAKEIRAGMRVMDSVPLTAIGAQAGAINSVSSRYFRSLSSVNVEKLIVQAQTSDAVGLARDVADALKKEFSNAVDEFDDGIAD